MRGEDEVTTEQPQRRTRAAGERSRRRVLEKAAQLATVEGLDGLSVGRLADASGMPKSSVYELFGSKEHIQLATVDAARESFIAEVVMPALATSEPGLEQLLALCEGFLSYVERRIFPGGCFFVAASAEMGGRPGPVAERVAQVQQEWRDLLMSEADRASRRDELPPNTDPAQLAFELGVILAGSNIISVLHDDHGAIDRAHVAVRTRLGIADRISSPRRRR